MIIEENKKMRKILNIVVKVILIVGILFLIHTVVNGVALENSQLVKGTEALVDAIVKWMTRICIAISIGYFIYYVYCLKTNDEGERRRNIQNIKTTLISVVIITCGVGIINLILEFYK